MNNIDDLTSHLANFVKTLSKVSTQGMEDGEDTVFSSCLPSNPIDSSKLSNQKLILGLLQADSFPSANQVTWSVSQNASLSQKVQEVFQKVSKIYESQGINVSQEEIKRISQEIEDINEDIEVCDLKIEKSKKKLKNDKNQDQILNQKIQEQNKYKAQLNEKMTELIQNNLHTVLKIQQEKIMSQISQNGSLPVNFQPENIQEILTTDQNNTPKAQGFEKFTYSSLAINEQIDILQDTFIQKLAEKLQGYGIGQFKSQDKLSLSIKDAFESIQIELEWKRVDFKRDWLNFNLLKVLLGELESQDQKSSGQNNISMQNSQIIPFVQVAAIVVKNLQIKGFQNNRNIKRNIARMQTEPESSLAFQFQISPDMQIDDNEIMIKLRAPRILGYILKPIIPIQKEDSEIEYSLTDNSSILTKLKNKKDFCLKDLLWQKNQKIKVRFVGQYLSQKYFANLSNLYKECINEWIQDKIPLLIDIDESKNCSIFQDYKDGFEVLHVKVDDSGQVYTLGIGKSLQKIKKDSDYNQLFGLKEFGLLVKQQSPNTQTVNKCKRIILHELGYVVGLIREFKNTDVQIDKQKVYKFYLKNFQKLQSDQIIYFLSHELEIETNNRIEIDVFEKRTTTNFEKFDERSIMYQPFPNQWLKEPQQIQPNTYISNKDFSVLDSHYGIFQTFKPKSFIGDSPNKKKNPMRDSYNDHMDIESKNYLQDLQKQLSEQKPNPSQQAQNNLRLSIQKRQKITISDKDPKKIDDLVQNQISRQNPHILQQTQDKEEEDKDSINLGSPTRIPKFEAKIKENQDKLSILIQRHQNDFIKSINLEEIKNQPIQKPKASQHQIQFEIKPQVAKRNDSDPRDQPQQRHINQYIQPPESPRNPQSMIGGNLLDNSFIGQQIDVSLSDINIEDTPRQVQRYHPEIEKQRDDIEALVKDQYNQELIFDCVKDYINHIPNYENQIIQLIKEVQAQYANPLGKKQEDDKAFLNFKIPHVDPEIKLLLVKVLIKKQLELKNQDMTLIRRSIDQQTLNTLKFYFDKFEAISNKKEELCDKELEECIKLMKAQETIDFILIKKQTLIHDIVLEQIYNSEINKIKNHKELINKFTQGNKDENEEKIIMNMIFQDNNKLTIKLIQIFKNDYNDYNQIKKYCIKHKVAIFLLQNEIEEFIRGIQDDKNLQVKQKQMQFFNKVIREDQVYCLQLLYFLNKEQMHESGIQTKQIKEVDPKSTWAIQNKNYSIIPVNQNKNIARVINKGFRINTSEDIEHAYFFQKKFEERNIFENHDKEEVAKFLETFKIYNSSDIPNNDKHDKFINQISQSKQNFQLKQDDFENVKHYLEEEEGYELLMTFLGKRQKKKENEEQNDDIEYTDLEKISQNLKVAIVLHQEEDFKNFKAYGSNFNIIQPINIIDHSKSSTYSILRLINLHIQLDVINVDDFKTRNQEIFDILPVWMQTFFGYKSLINYIQNPDTKQIKQREIDNLLDLVKLYKRYEKEPSDDLQRMIQQQCILIRNSDKFIFEEWYEQIQQSKQGKKFAYSYDLIMARTNPAYLVRIQKETKRIFQDPENLLTLKDFNRLCARIDKNLLNKLFKETLYDPKVFSRNVINQLFGFFNRRESLQSFVSDLKNIGLKVEISSKFLINFLLQNCDLSLKSRIIYYQSEYFSIPLIMNCLFSYEKSPKQKLIYIPEIAFNMLEGAGIFNFAAGSRSIYQIGKSTILNDLLFPIIENNQEAFEQQDKNIFSSGQVDVFFEKSFTQKRNIVLMDGQGILSEEAIKSSLILTDIVMLHFHRQDFEDQNQLADLKNKIQLIQNAKNNLNKDIHIMLIIRDAPESSILKSQNQGKFSNQYFQAKHLENFIDSCVQLENMGTLTKNQRIEKMYPLLQHFYQLVEVYGQDQSKHSFTKNNYIENFLAQNQSNDQTVQVVTHIIKMTEDFMKEVYKISDNIFQEKALPVLKFKNQIRQKIIEIRNFVSQLGTDLQQNEEEELLNELKYIQNNLKNSQPSEILLKFHEIIIDKNSLMILQEISQQLRVVTLNGTKEPRQRRSDLLSQNNNKNTQIIQFNNFNEQDLKIQKLGSQLMEIDEEIYQKSISLEYFWRALTFYTEKTNSDYLRFSADQQKLDIFESIKNQLTDGSCYELIDGENLEFKGKILSEVLGRQHKSDKILVVCVIGPQSSGKSTLMNFAFGTQFFTSSGRCTKGIYFTLQQMPDEIRQQSDVKWLLMLDTEGLQSPERIDAEYDRKIVLFALLSADILIINNKGEINSTMIETLTMCCLTFDNLKKFCACPEILYVNCQQNDSNKETFKRQLQDMKQKVKEQSESETIDETANELLSVKDDNLLIMGYAYKNDSIEKDQKKGIYKNNQFKVSVTNFGVETSEIFIFLKSFMERKHGQTKQIGYWLENSQQNWNLIDKYSQNLIQFSNILELKNDKKVQAQLNKLWNEYFQKQNEFDDLKCNQEKQRLAEILKQNGVEDMKIELHKVEYQNDQEKEYDIKKYIFDPFDQWKMEQKGLTVSSEKLHKSMIRTKMDAIQNEFKVKLRAKIQEEQMLMVNKNGHKRILNRANEISKDQFYKDMEKQQKKQYLENQFEENWEKSLDEIQGIAQIEQMKKSYFSSLLKTFKSFNPFIHVVGDGHYQQILNKINKIGQEGINYQQLGKFIEQELKQIDDQEQQQKGDNCKKLFNFNNEMLYQIKEDPKERIFDQTKQEQYLYLRELIHCDYVYTIIKDLNEDLDKEALFKQMLKELTLQKQKQVVKQRHNYYGHTFKEKTVVWEEDLPQQQSNLRLLLLNLQDAGFLIRLKSQYDSKIQECKPTFLDDKILSIFDGFEPFGKDKDFQRKQNKIKWINEFINQLVFKRNNYIKIDPRISSCFKSSVFELKNRPHPNESLVDHKNSNIQLQNALFIPEPFIRYNPAKTKIASKINIAAMKILINPIKSENDVLIKWQKLSYIAFNKLDWEKIAFQIIDSVSRVLGNKNYESRDSSVDEDEEMNIENIMKLNQITYDQVKTLESEFLTVKLREIINGELHSKMGLYMNEQMNAKISWCAMLVTWIQLSQKAVSSFNKQYKSLKNQKEQYQQVFYKMINEGKNDELTKQSTKAIISDSYKLFIEDIQNSQKKIILEALEDKRVLFDNIAFYENIDTFYANELENDYVEYIQYVNDPVPIFEKYAQEMKIDEIDQYILERSREAQNIIQENLIAIYQIIKKLQEAITKSQIQWNKIQLSDYFSIEYGSSILQIQDIYDLQDSLSPVINLVFRRILQGIFDMSPFQQMIEGPQKQKMIYTFIPKTLQDNGPLEIFSDYYLKNDIQEILDNPEYKYLLDKVIQRFQTYQLDENNKVFQIDVMIDEIERKIDEYLNRMQREKDFDENWFDVAGPILNIVNTAIGCKSKCKFCNRKCELGQHTQLEALHSCDKMGHQMRVFAGGNFQNDRGDKFPSLLTCDMINPNTVIVLNEQKNTWKEVVETQMQEWEVKYKQGNHAIAKNANTYRAFWERAGQEFCKLNNYEYIDYEDNQNLITKMYEKTLIIILLDESGSMSGSRWRNSVNGGKDLIKFLKENHHSHQEVNIIIIFFDDAFRVMHDSTLDQPIEDSIWENPNYGGTEWGGAFTESFNRMSQLIGNVMNAKLYFFTDGFAPYPQAALDGIENDMVNTPDIWRNQQGGLKLQVLLMCENSNATMILVQRKFNDLSERLGGNPICRLLQNVDTSQIGSLMIENFTFNN